MMECHDGNCVEGMEDAEAHANFGRKFEMPMMHMPDIGRIERQMENAFGGVEARIRHDMEAMNDRFSRMEHNIGEIPREGNENAEHFEMSSENY